MPAMEPSHRLAQWFKLQYKGTVCAEISGYDWSNTAELIEQHLSAKGQGTFGKLRQVDQRHGL